MSTKKPIRRIAPYYEVGSFGVPKEYASAVCRSAVGVVSRYVGPIALVSIKGMRIRSDGSELPLSRLHIMNEESHTVLFTKRTVTDAAGGLEGHRLGGLTRVERILVTSLTPTEIKFGIEEKTAIAVAVNNGTGLMNQPAAMMATIHEIGHSFSLGHCEVTETCVMSPTDEGWRGSHAVPKKPFCDDHGSELRNFAAKAAADVLLNFQ